MLKPKLFNYLITFLTIGGGILFTVGSVVYLPSLSYINGNVGAIIFIAGSIFYFSCDILGISIDPEFTPLKPLQNIGSLRAFLTTIGNILFIIGSVFFLPQLPSVIGIDVFVLASLFVIIPQILTCYGLFSHHGYNYLFYVRHISLKKPLIVTSIMLMVACLMFLVGTIQFYDKKSETIGLFVEGVGMFIGGSALFLVASLIGAYYRHFELGENNLIDPFIEAQSFRP